MFGIKLHRLVLSFLAVILLDTVSSYASAEIIDDITVHQDASGGTDTVIKFTVPIQYLRHFPQGKSSSTSIYFNILNTVPVDEWQDYESHRTPPSDLVQEIMVTTRDRGTGPKIHITFYRPAEFTVGMGSDNQTLVIHIKPVATQQNNENKPVAGQSGVTSIPVAAAPAAVIAAIPKSPPVAPSSGTPAVAAANQKSAAPPAPVPAATTATPAAPVAPTGNITVPKVALKPSSSKPIHIPLGGKDGLPPFPEIDQFVVQQGTTPANASLADKILIANNQAAALMENGGNALLTGQTFAAIESFNQVLNLPPNKYTEDAQLWIGIAKERSGQLSKAVLEFNAYLRLYPEGKSATWVKDRLAKLKLSQPAIFAALDKQPTGPARMQNTEFQYSEFGSLSMYYYQGASQTNTVASAGAIQTPTTFSLTDQKSLITNLNMTARSYNNEYDNRLVFQDFYAANFLPGQQNISMLGAAYYEMKDRIVDYSFRVGRQSGLGGGVMGRFDGVSAGYGFASNWRVNVVTGQLSDFTIDRKPTFYGASLDFGTKSQLGGSVYGITQQVDGFIDRRAVGGNLRYFDQKFNIMSMVDYDVLFKALNIFTLQGTLNGGGVGGTDYNFLLDRRRSPVLDVRNAINGTTSTIATLMQNGWSMSDLILLAGQRTTVSNMAQVGMTNHLSEKWFIGTDFSIAKTAGMNSSGTLLPDGTTGVEGFVPAIPSTGNTWTITERATGLGVIRPQDTTNFSVSYSRGALITAEGFQASNHVDLQEKWTLDSTFVLNFQTDNTGGKMNDVQPTIRVAYKLRRNLSTDAQLGLDWNKTTSTVLQSTSTALREFVAFGFRLDF
jgi:TolA-binding protein